MKRLKTFFRYALCIAAFWFLSDFLIYMGINGTYKAMETRVMIESPNISVTEAKATYVNGYVKGNVYNNTNDNITDKYVKMDFYSKRDVYLGSKYVRIENLEAKKSQDFEMWFKYNDVSYCNISVVDNVENVTQEAFLSEETKYYMVIAFLFTLYFL